MKIIFALLTITLFTSCSNNKKSDEIPLGDPEAVSDENSEFVLETDPAVADSTAISNNVETNEVISSGSEEIKTEILSDNKNGSDLTTAIEEYTAVEGDSLMWLAFKIYGDYGKWKSLLELNPEKSRGHFQNGEIIKYYVPVERFVWEPKGLPYIIKNKDSLASISKIKYGTTKQWKAIFDNNRPMIKHPNLIFAGFTLYYLKDVRDLASE